MQRINPTSTCCQRTPSRQGQIGDVHLAPVRLKDVDSAWGVAQGVLDILSELESSHAAQPIQVFEVPSGQPAEARPERIKGLQEFQRFLVGEIEFDKYL